GAFTQADDSRIVSAAGDIRVHAHTDIQIGGITTSAHVSLVATTGSITDAGDADGEDIVADGLRLHAAVGIGAADAAIETKISTLTARATSGGIHLLEADGLVVDD